MKSITPTNFAATLLVCCAVFLGVRAIGQNIQGSPTTYMWWKIFGAGPGPGPTFILDDPLNRPIMDDPGNVFILNDPH